MTSRRAFVGRAAKVVVSGIAATAVVARTLEAQQGRGATRGSVDTTNLFAMDQAAAQTVRRTPKPGAKPSMTREERDGLEHRIRCQCGCTLDVYTCRTTDFTCQVSPAMHRDIVALVEGGYDAREIIDAFMNTYGERALMEPTKSGFNLVGWLAPGVALITGAVAVAILIRKWDRERPTAAVNAPALDATPDELARVEAAVRGDDA